VGAEDRTWRLTKTNDPVIDAHICRMESPIQWLLLSPQPQQQEIGAVYVAISQVTSGPTRIELSISALRDIRAEGMGLQVDRHPLAYAQLTDRTHGTFDPATSAQLLVQMRTGTTLTFRLHLWPYRQQYNGTIALSGFAQALTAYQQCSTSLSRLW
jgi:invasion protein IalB